MFPDPESAGVLRCRTSAKAFLLVVDIGDEWLCRLRGTLSLSRFMLDLNMVLFQLPEEHDS